MTAGFPRLYAAASLKLKRMIHLLSKDIEFSAALCRGLIEAHPPLAPVRCSKRSFPRLYAAASLKHPHPERGERGLPLFSAALCRGLIEAAASASILRRAPPGFSAALCRGLIEARPSARWSRRAGGFSAALCRGLIEAARPASPPRSCAARFPRLYAAASLKRDPADAGRLRKG